MGSNRNLTVAQTLFSFQGRIGRLSFIGFNLLVGLIALPLLYWTLMSMRDIAGAPQTFGNKGLSLTILWLAMMWPGSALLVKRLHDLNRSGLHAFWITGLWYLPAGELFATTLALPLQLFAIATSFWLLATPGRDGPNIYGLKSGMTVDRHPSGLSRATS